MMKDNVDGYQRNEFRMLSNSIWGSVRKSDNRHYNGAAQIHKYFLYSFVDLARATLVQTEFRRESPVNYECEI
ncbi:hypothetical protein ZHAS_00016349 [Anopheles sinensis]|uniref:Uncharacterized protein n=1 Tax=Anopheles sinensis TaxID=74873 RepID=A0A084WDD5_ANOSI|nr:hypothetical protein ZHAS_00016349 [Anopheles sinensis]